MGYPEEPFLRSFFGVAALRAAVRLGMLDKLAEASLPLDEIVASGPAMRQLVDALEAEGVLRTDGVVVALSAAFADVWAARRGALVSRLEMLALTARDALARPEALFGDLRAFMAASETFALFRYDRAASASKVDRAHTKIWCDYVAALTSAEAPAIADTLGVDGPAQALEIGGNVGVMSEAIRRRDPRVETTVMDLEGVCALGEERCAALAPDHAPRFLAGDARRDAWPDPVDFVLFKSVLHDWPEEETRAFIGKARAALRARGEIAVCERGPLVGGTDAGAAPFSATADLVFAPFYRGPGVYEGWLRAAGFDDVRRAPVAGFDAFYVVRGRAP